MKRVRINTLLLCCAATLLGAGILGAQPKLPQKEIPILAWYGIPADEATVERFQELKDDLPSISGGIPMRTRS